MLTFTDRAREMVLSFMDQSEEELTALRISSGDATPGTPSWELTLVADDEWKATDMEVEVDDELTVLVERNVAGLLEDATIDYVEREGREGFQVQTRPVEEVGGPGPEGTVAAGTRPAAPSGDRDRPGPEGSPAASADEEENPFAGAGAETRPPPTEDEKIEIEDPPQGPLADRIREILEERINPAVSMHGGHIGLADVQDTEIYILMSGGCQGCALSRMTLKQGVERMIRQEVPEVSAVHDVTDHGSGENPYYEAPID